MNTIFANASVVILANDVNLSIFKPLWLVKTNILREDEFEEGVVISPVAVHIPTPKLQFDVFPNRIQVTLPKLYPEAQTDIDRILGGIVKTLPHTPYRAVGLNFTYMTAPEDDNAFPDWNRRLFSSRFACQAHPADDPGARFGSYFSFDILDTRLKVDIKPVKASAGIEQLSETWHRGQDIIAINLNFHTDLTEAGPTTETILDKLGKWDEALSLARETANKLLT